MFIKKTALKRLRRALVNLPQAVRLRTYKRCLSCGRFGHFFRNEKGRWVDNVLIERLWRSVKYEDVYLKEYPTVVALRHGIGVYFHFYNNERPHDSLGKCTPSEYYDGLREVA